MDLHLTDKVYVVTGASAGIGKATTQLFAQEGAIVVGVARNPDDIADLGDRIQPPPDSAAAVSGQISFRQVLPGPSCGTNRVVSRNNFPPSSTFQPRKQ